MVRKVLAEAAKAPLGGEGYSRPAVCFGGSANHHGVSGAGRARGSRWPPPKCRPETLEEGGKLSPRLRPTKNV